MYTPSSEMNKTDLEKRLDDLARKALFGKEQKHSESWLNDDGCIPSGSVCPFRIICTLRSVCQHLGIKHTKPFSCGNARAYDITKSKLIKE